MAEILLILATFWLGGAWAAAAWGFGLFMAAVALTGICPLCWIKCRQLVCDAGVAKRSQSISWPWLAPLLMVLAALPLVAGYWSFRYTGQVFVERVTGAYLDFRAVAASVNSDDPLAVAQAAQADWVVAQAQFGERYRSYRPLVIKDDGQFGDDLTRLDAAVRTVGEQLAVGNRVAAQVTLLGLRTTWSELFRRNQLIGPELAVAAVADPLAAMVQAGERRHAPTVLNLYPEVELRLRLAGEQLGPARQGVLVACQQALEALKEAAQLGQPAVLEERSAALRDAYQQLSAF